ncbi:hypothetical protein ACH5RR_001266 [Cinchona calisaya]|uniref:Uncharacterized protein n=1 Tax=Cinchona calisaya TaxID=153742 RepID=A0ABD3B2X7_9GENT
MEPLHGQSQKEEEESKALIKAKEEGWMQIKVMGKFLFLKVIVPNQPLIGCNSVESFVFYTLAMPNKKQHVSLENCWACELR